MRNDNNGFEIFYVISCVCGSLSALYFIITKVFIPLFQNF